MTLKCKDIYPEANCGYEATGNNEEEVLNKMAQHVQATHKDIVQGTDVNEMKDKWRKKISQQ